MGNELIGATEASTILGRSVRMVQRLAKEGKLPIAQKMPGATGAYLFDRDTVEASKGVVQWPTQN